MRNKFCGAVVFFAVMALAVSAMAFSVGDAWNTQSQVQSLSGQDYGTTGAESKYRGEQADVGFSSASGGGVGIEYNHQVQGAHINVYNSTGTVRHQYDIDTETRGASDALLMGVGGHAEGTSTSADIVTRSDGVGTGMVSGSIVTNESASVSSAALNADGVGMTNVDARTEYENANVGATSVQYSAGTSEVITSTTAYSDIGLSGASASASTAGGTAMANDGLGTSMSTIGVSHSEVDTATVGTGAGYSTSSAMAANGHSSAQASSAYGTYQYQETSVATGAAE